MRTAEEIFTSARDEAPFSNGTEIHAWMENWCWQCHNPAELAWRRYEEGKRKTEPKEHPGGCPLILCAMNGKTPTEFLEQSRRSLGDQYHCIEFRGPDEGGGDSAPHPKPEPTDMEGLFPRPERRVRMLQQPEPSRELVPV